MKMSLSDLIVPADSCRLMGMGVDHITSPSRTGSLLLDKKNLNLGMQSSSADIFYLFFLISSKISGATS
jgi:hypothetical protein